MPGGENAFKRLLARVQAGDEDAVTELIDDYGPHILMVARRSITRQLRTRFDSQDFVQAVWASVFADPTPWQNLTGPRDLAGFLAALARHKVLDEIRRRYHSQKHELDREVPLDELSIDEEERLIAADPTPSQVAVAKERWEQLLADQPTRRRNVLEMRFGGATYTQIADHLGLHERTVRRIIERMFQDDPSDDTEDDLDEIE